MQISSLPRRFQLRHGAVTPLTVLCLALLVGVAALVIDGGTLMEARRHVQAAADAAALAGADDLYANYLTNQGIDVRGTAQNSALATASANGFTNDGVQSIVTVNSPGQNYKGGPNAGKTIPPGYFEVVIQYNATHLFSGVFGSGTSPIQARAVARGRSTPVTNNGVMALNLSLGSTLNVASVGGLTVNGRIQVSSSNSSPLAVLGSGTVTATQYILNPAMGGGGGGGGLLGTILSLLGSVVSLLFGPGGTAHNIVLSPPPPDPLRFLPPPPKPLVSQSNSLLVIPPGTTTRLLPGVYTDGIQISGTLLSPTNITLQGNTDGTPNVYYLDGQNGLQVSGNVTISLDANAMSAGVLIYNNWSDSDDAINLNIQGSLTLVPLASGLYRGLCIFQKRGTPLSGGNGPSITLSTQLGTTNVRGTIYAPYAKVKLATDISSNVICGQVIADTVRIGGTANVTIDPGTYPTANQRQVGLVE